MNKAFKFRFSNNGGGRNTTAPPSRQRQSEKFTRRYWDFRAVFYMIFYNIPLLSHIANNEHKSIKKIIRETSVNCDHGISLNIGCGTKAVDYMENGFKNICLDISSKMLFWARSAYPDYRYVQADTFQVPFEDESISIIVAVGLTEYLRSPEDWLHEMYRLLKPGGLLLFTSTPHRFPSLIRRLWSPNLNFRSLTEWENLCRSQNFQPLTNRHLLLQDHLLCRKQKETIHVSSENKLHSFDHLP